MIKKISVFSVVLFFALSGIALAWGRGNLVKNGRGPRAQLVGCETVNYSGTVNSVGEPRQGIVLDTVDGLVTVYGIGSDWCWEDQGISKPEVGDEVNIDCCEITFSDGSFKLRAVTVVTEEGIIELIDTETGERLCKSKPKRNRWQNRNINGNAGGRSFLNRRRGY